MFNYAWRGTMQFWHCPHLCALSCSIAILRCMALQVFNASSQGGCKYTPLNFTKLTCHHWIMTIKWKCTFCTPLNLLIYSEPTSKNSKNISCRNIMSLRTVQLIQEIDWYCHLHLNPPDYHAVWNSPLQYFPIFQAPFELWSVLSSLQWNTNQSWCQFHLRGMQLLKYLQMAFQVALHPRSTLKYTALAGLEC